MRPSAKFILVISKPMNIQLDSIRADITRAVREALAEDIGDGDITAMLIPGDQINTAEIITREDCILCGQAWLEETFAQLGGLDSIQWHAQDGEQVTAGSKLVTLRGNARRLLTGERTALNFIQLLSGTATKAHQFAQLLPNSNIKILDTRKTIPGLRTAQKYAITCGGCHNHRIGLYDMFLIKENHIAACGGITAAVEKAREIAPDKRVEVEVETREELLEAIAAKADVVMLDNFTPDDLQYAFALDKQETKYELSGNLDFANLGSVGNYKIDYCSFGALTKHITAVDLSMRVAK